MHDTGGTKASLGVSTCPPSIMDAFSLLSEPWALTLLLSNTGVLRVVSGRLLCSCPNFARYLHAVHHVRGRKAFLAFFPFLPPWNTPVLFFSLAHPADKPHFLVSHTDSIARFGQDPAKGKKEQMLWDGRHSGPWPLGPPCLHKGTRDASHAPESLRKWWRAWPFLQSGFGHVLPGMMIEFDQRALFVMVNPQAAMPAVLPPFSGSLVEAPM